MTEINKIISASYHLTSSWAIVHEFPHLVCTVSLVLVDRLPDSSGLCGEVHLCVWVEWRDAIVCICLVVGDTLFTATCGRFFEGTAEQMHRALIEILGKLPPETVGYTIANCSCGVCEHVCAYIHARV